jgi:hypothetical protein
MMNLDSCEAIVAACRSCRTMSSYDVGADVMMPKSAMKDSTCEGSEGRFSAPADVSTARICGATSCTRSSACPVVCRRLSPPECRQVVDQGPRHMPLE